MTLTLERVAVEAEHTPPSTGNQEQPPSERPDDAEAFERLAGGQCPVRPPQGRGSDPVRSGAWPTRRALREGMAGAARKGRRQRPLPRGPARGERYLDPEMVAC
jgi:hypothetical protein